MHLVKDDNTGHVACPECGSDMVTYSVDPENRIEILNCSACGWPITQPDPGSWFARHGLIVVQEHIDD